MSILDRVALATLPALPRGVMRMLASRYIAGETLESAISKLSSLQEQGYLGILDLLGEDVAGEAEARRVAATYRAAATALHEAGIDAYVSIKPTHLGLRVSETLTCELYEEVVRHCDTLGSFVRVEMEDHTTTDATLRVFERLRAVSKNVGIVLQSRLFRTPNDVAALADGPLSVRLVKGVYLEPAEIAHVAAEPIRDAFVQLAAQLFERGAYVSIATHDELLAERVLDLCRDRPALRQRFELQVLMGVREALWESWRSAGHQVRVYVPYGPEWRAYSTRRLRKNPQIFRHVLRDLVLRR